MKISFDIGGVLSKYPDKFRRLISCLVAGGAEVYVITDMKRDDALELLGMNGFGFVDPTRVLGADYGLHGERCKQVLLRELGIDVHVDDMASYCAAGGALSLFVWPDPDAPYYADEFVAPVEHLFSRCRPKAG